VPVRSGRHGRMVRMPTVAALTIAPVKALAAVPVPEVVLGRDGVDEDRRLFVVRADGAVVTMRSQPRLTQVVPTLDLPGGTLTLRFPDGTEATTKLDSTGAPVEATLFGKRRTGTVLSGEAADALSEYADEPLRLVLADRTGVGWDEGPVSLIGRASVRAVGTPEDGLPHEGARFRMLVDVEGLAPYEEDTWVGREVRLGDVVVLVTHPLGRCVVVNHSPRSGDRDWSGLHEIAAHRQGAVTLGVIAEVLREGTVRVGDPVEAAGAGSRSA